MIQTYQTNLSNIPLDHNLTSDMYLSEYACFFGMLERKLFVQSYIKRISTSCLKKKFSKQFGLTARQFNSLRIQMEGKVSSILEKRKYDIQELESKMAYLQKFIFKKTTQKDKLLQKLLRIPQTSPAFSKLRKKHKNIKFCLHQKKRRLRNVQHKLEKLKSDVLNHKIRICFGSRKLFHQQFNLKENKYKNHGEWKEEWLKSRNSQFLVVGSRDETYGNQSATYDLQNVLNLRVANYFISKYGKYVRFPEVQFPYGQEFIDQAKVPYMGYTRNGKPQKYYYSSITYRFIKTEKRVVCERNCRKRNPKNKYIQSEWVNWHRPQCRIFVYM